jgi:hypothetical protein
MNDSIDAAKTSLLAWLAEPYGKNLPFSSIDPVRELIGPTPTRLQVFAALRRMLNEYLEKSGGVDVIGAISHGKGIYGRKGLFERERKELERLQGFIDGWLTSRGNEEKAAVDEALTDEWLRVAKLSPTPSRGGR